jgi:hypothetical protein
MPLPTPHAASITSAVSNLIGAVTDLVTGVQGALRDAHVREAAGRAKVAAVETTAAVSAKSAKLKKALKAYWAGMKGKARAARVAKMLKGRGLKPKGKAKSGAKLKRGAGSKSAVNARGRRGKAGPQRVARMRAAVANSWARLTPEERAARVAKMRAGRGLKPKAASRTTT